MHANNVIVEVSIGDAVHFAREVHDPTLPGYVHEDFVKGLIYRSKRKVISNSFSRSPGAGTTSGTRRRINGETQRE